MASNADIVRELDEMKSKIYLPSSYADCALRFQEIVNNNLNEETRDAVFAVLEAASKSIGKDEFSFMACKRIFVTAYHQKSTMTPEQQQQIREWGLQAAQLPYSS